MTHVANTSIHAWMNEVAPTLGARQIAVAELFEQHPERDFTNSEIATALEWSINRITPRVKELREFGILTLSTRRACRVTGRLVQAWKISVTAPVSIKALGQTPIFRQVPSNSQRGRTQTVKLNGESAVCTCRGYYYRGHCRHVEAAVKRTPEPQEQMGTLF